MLASLLAAAAVAISPACDLEHPSGQPGCTRAQVDGLKINQIQVVGSHNSYKQAITPPEMAMLKARNPKAAETLDYSHEPLTQQLDAGVRQLELDFVYDPQGGRYATPLFHKMFPGAAPYDAAPMKAPGMKVIHVPDIDYRSVCQRLADCFREIKAWSDKH